LIDHLLGLAPTVVVTYLTLSASGPSRRPRYLPLRQANFLLYFCPKTLSLSTAISHQTRRKFYPHLFSFLLSFVQYNLLFSLLLSNIAFSYSLFLVLFNAFDHLQLFYTLYSQGALISSSVYLWALLPTKSGLIFGIGRKFTSSPNYRE
jgi:hypothetical protein